MTAAHRSTPEGRRAFSMLCEKYWYPLYAHARRVESDVHTAMDLTQGFFEKVIERNYMADADPARGRFRTFLLTSFSNFITNEWDKLKAAKRGGGQLHLTLEFERSERRYSLEPIESQTPERLFDRRWAETLLARVLAQLQSEYEKSGRGTLFSELKQYLTAGNCDRYGTLSQRLQMSEGAIKVAVSRLRSRYRERLCEEIAETTARQSDVSDEIRCLFDAFSK